MPVSDVNSDDIKGKLEAQGDEFILKDDCNSSLQRGKVELKPFSAWYTERLVNTSFVPKSDSILSVKRSRSSWVFAYIVTYNPNLKNFSLPWARSSRNFSIAGRSVSRSGSRGAPFSASPINCASSIPTLFLNCFKTISSGIG